VSNSHLINAEQKQAALDYIIRAINTLQAPQNGDSFTSFPHELVALSEPNLKSVVRNLLAAIAQLIPANHPDAPLRAEVEMWLNT
jgi:hypothetical protein